MASAATTKIVGAAANKLVELDSVKAVTDEKAQLVAKFSEILAERDARIEWLEGQISKLGGTVAVAKSRTQESYTDSLKAARERREVEYADYLERIAADHPDPARRQRALDALDALGAD